ncbi:TetR/AcrR family transcriptional regulator [Sphaerisporangium fuscum]|uniref:TetR/AcrR family transcriptional regulator n=1 Tax=Sphaerisporangium fuscum TaxID=2835868 RepID=UPI001BDD0152|nr:TetR/AcrR family transcriptional regulator [Sphaerisporangium fuscum]
MKTDAGPESVLGTRERIVRATSRLIQRQGYEGTGLKQISREAGATLGSVYHFFPGGKQELAVAAIRHGDEEFAGILRAALAGEDDPAKAMVACARVLAEELRASEWMDGCPVSAAALETAGRIPEIQQACVRAFEHWRGLVSEKLIRAGIPEGDARDLACTVVNTFEGAEMTAQVTRSQEPLLVAGGHLARLVASYR